MKARTIYVFLSWTRPQKAKHQPYHKDSFSQMCSLHSKHPSSNSDNDWVVWTGTCLFSSAFLLPFRFAVTHMSICCSIVCNIHSPEQLFFMHNTHKFSVTYIPTNLFYCSLMPVLGVESNLASATSTLWLLNIQKQCFYSCFQTGFRKEEQHDNAHWPHGFTSTRAPMNTCVIIDRTNSEIPDISA